MEDLKNIITRTYRSSNVRRILLLSNLFLLFIFSSCTKEDLLVCGTVTGGEVEFNQVANNYLYYLSVDGYTQRVDQKTYESFYVGDYICLE